MCAWGCELVRHTVVVDSVLHVLPCLACKCVREVVSSWDTVVVSSPRVWRCELVRHTVVVDSVLRSCELSKCLIYDWIVCIICWSFIIILFLCSHEWRNSSWRLCLGQICQHQCEMAWKVGSDWRKEMLHMGGIRTECVRSSYVAYIFFFIGLVNDWKGWLVSLYLFQPMYKCTIQCNLQYCTIRV